MPNVPVKRYQLMKRRYPELMKAVETLGLEATSAGPLEEKTKHLVQLGAAAALGSEGAVHSHARRALQAGATRDEVQHALILLVSTIGFPQVVAAMSWLDDLVAPARRRASARR